MILILLDRDPAYAEWLRLHIQTAWPELPSMHRMTPGSGDFPEDMAVIYTPEQFPSFDPYPSPALRIHSRRPDLELLPDEIEQLEHEGAELLYRDDALSVLMAGIRTFLTPLCPHRTGSGNVTVTMLPLPASPAAWLQHMVARRLTHCDSLILLPVMPAYLWPFLTEETVSHPDVAPDAQGEAPQSVSDLLLTLSVSRRPLPELVPPCLCPCRYGGLTLRAPHRSDDLILLDPELLRLLMESLTAYAQKARPETVEVLCAFYGASFHLAASAYARADRYFFFPETPGQPFPPLLAREWAALHAGIPANAEALALPRTPHTKEAHAS